VKKDDFWIDTCIAKLLDSYPDLLKND